MMLNNKRSQEEIVGFILIIILVVIIALVFLGISIRKPAEKLPSVELESFLQASMRFSTECRISEERRLDLKDLIVSCSKNENCMNSSSCSELNKTMIKILDNSWKPGTDNPTKMYKIEIVDWNNGTILSLRKGNSSSGKLFSDLNIPSYSGDLRVELEIDS